MHSGRMKYFLSQIYYARASQLLGKGDKAPPHLVEPPQFGPRKNSWSKWSDHIWDSENRRKMGRQVGVLKNIPCRSLSLSLSK